LKVILRLYLPFVVFSSFFVTIFSPFFSRKRKGKKLSFFPVTKEKEGAEKKSQKSLNVCFFQVWVVEDLYSGGIHCCCFFEKKFGIFEKEVALSKSLFNFLLLWLVSD